MGTLQNIINRQVSKCLVIYPINEQPPYLEKSTNIISQEMPRYKYYHIPKAVKRALFGQPGLHFLPKACIEHSCTDPFLVLITIHFLQDHK